MNAGVVKVGAVGWAEVANGPGTGVGTCLGGACSGILVSMIVCSRGGTGAVALPWLAIAASRAGITAPQVWKRRAGSFSRHFWTTCSNKGLIDGLL